MTWLSMTKTSSKLFSEGVLMSSKKNEINPKKVLNMFLPIVGAVFIAVSSILYILYKSWSNKVYFEKWKDYEDCGV
jgi:hypothetical protein